MAKTTKNDETSTKKTASKAAPKAKKAAADAPGSEVKAAAKAKAPKAKGTPGAKRAPLAPKTFFESHDKVTPKWKLVDAKGQTLGRLSTVVANLLMGKHLPSYTRHAGTGDFVIVVNASHVVVTGAKAQNKLYQWHTGYPGGVKTLNFQEMLEKHPDRVIERAVNGMLPRGHMGRVWRKRLRVFGGAEHNHQAQQPEAVTLSKKA